MIQLVTSDLGFLESFCLIGGIPVMMGMYQMQYCGFSLTPM